MNRKAVEKSHTSIGGVIKDEAHLNKKHAADQPAIPERQQHAPDRKPPQDIKTPRSRQHRQISGNNRENLKEGGGHGAELQKPESAAPDNRKNAESQHGAKYQREKPVEAKEIPDKSKLKWDRKANKAEKQAQKAADKLESAKSKLPSKYKLRMQSLVNEKTGIAKKRLRFEKTPIPQREHIKGRLPVRPVKAAGNAAIIQAHRKIYQAENENVSIKAMHRTEMVAEAGTRTALRFRKTAPYKKVAKLEHKASKKSVKLTYRKTLAENPKLRKNPVARMLQKRRIKRDYAKAAREAKKTANKAASATKKIAEAMARHPFVTVALVLVMLLMMFVIPFTNTCAGFAGSMTSVVTMSTYLAADEDMLDAEKMYAEMEEDLQYKIDNYEDLYPGYDEYHINPDRIWHDPYVLMAILHALHDGEWTIGDVKGTLIMLFNRQYTEYERVEVERRYRTVKNTYINPYTGLPYEVTETEAYDWYIRKYQLINENLSHLPIYIMGEARLSRYATLMWSLGNRPDLFPAGTYPDASTYKEPLKYEVKQAYIDADPTFAAIVKEAEKYIGMPYVWGGYNPNTSFDCSGYVSWVMNQTGWDIGRLGAQGLHSYSKEVPKSQAKPGDLVFFYGTYNAPNPLGATHVGIYVGDGMMIHAGNPIGYESIETSYWQGHFLAFGRIY